MRVLIGVLCGLAAVAGAGCGDSSPTAPSGGGASGGGSSGGGGTTLTATFSSIQSQIFATRCFQCHGANRQEQGLNLETNGYANIVNRPSTQQSSLMRIAPSNTEQSYLLHKVEGRSTITGLRMPQLQAALTTEQITAIRTWIQNGAPNN